MSEGRSDGGRGGWLVYLNEIEEGKESKKRSQRENEGEREEIETKSNTSRKDLMLSLSRPSDVAKGVPSPYLRAYQV